MRILIISSQETFRQGVQASCLRFDGPNNTLRTADSIGQGLDLSEQIEAEIVIIDLTRNVEAGMLAITSLAKVKHRLIVASADKFTTDLMARAIRAGAQEVLAQPLQEDEVHEILQKAQHLLAWENTTNAQREGKVIVTFSSKGGVGKTTVSCNLAVMLAKRLGPGKVALIDANTQAPNVQAMLDLRPDNWLRDAILEYKRIDSDMLRQLMTRHESGLDVLAHSSDNPLGLDFTEDQMSKIILVAKGTYDYIFIDTFPLLSSLNLAVMDLADCILLITESVVPALRSAKYNLQMLDQAGYGQNRIKLVINRYARFRGNVNPDFVAETLAWPVKHVLPYTSDATVAANAGQPVSAMFADNKLSSALNTLLDDITGVPAQMSEEGILAKWLKSARETLGI